MPGLEQQYTSTGSKLWRNLDAVKALQDGTPQPVVCHVMPTSKCNLQCSYCSVKNRPNEDLEPDAVLAFLHELQQRGLKAVIISGGGNPLLWPHLSDLICEAEESLGLRVGLITNGGKARAWRHLTVAALNALTWMRLSLSSIDQAGSEHELEEALWTPEDMPDTLTFGCSYIWWDDSDKYMHEVIPALKWVQWMKTPEYIRLLPDCLDFDKLPERIAFLEGLAERLGHPPFFSQNKRPAAPERCWLGYLHPVLNTDGWVYPCDSLVLNPGADEHFHEDWRVCRMAEVGTWYDLPGNPASLVDAPRMCPGCVWTTHNRALDAAVTACKHEEFI